MRLSFLLNWTVNPYHAPIVVAQEMGFYKERDIDLSLLEPRDPSDVTKIIGEGQIPLGLKAMVHCYAARHRGYPLCSIGTLFDEPPTGLISRQEKAIHSAEDFKGKRLGYVGEFGKIMIDKLALDAQVDPQSYSTHKIGMHAARAILNDEVDAAIGLSCFQQLEMEDAGVRTHLLRIDKLANLGCCCFCSIMFIAHESFMEKEKSLLTHFMQATRLGVELTRENPTLALACLQKQVNYLNPSLLRNIFYAMMPFFSKDLKNNPTDWEKVGLYAARLGIASKSDYTQLYTNAYV